MTSLMLNPINVCGLEYDCFLIQLLEILVSFTETNRWSGFIFIWLIVQSNNLLNYSMLMELSTIIKALSSLDNIEIINMHQLLLFAENGNKFDSNSDFQSLLNAVRIIFQFLIPFNAFMKQWILQECTKFVMERRD